MLIPAHAAAGAASAAMGLARTAISAMGQAERRIAGQAREFESVFLGQVLNTMNTGIGENSGFDGGHAEGQWRSLLNDNLGRNIASQGGIGIASSVSRELLRAQEAR